MKIITTVGTSLINNSGEDCCNLENNPFSEELFDGLNDTNIKDEINNKGIKLIEFILDEEYDASAELATLKKLDPEGKAEVYLLCTETVLSFICGRALKKHLGERAHLEYIKGLQVKDAKVFHEIGFLNLFRRIVQINQGEDPVLLNISGGYKALIPPITLLAQLEKIPLYYIYEDSNELIETGSIPINFDWGIIEEYTSYLHRPKAIETAEDSILKKLRELKLIEPESRQLTIIGQMLAEYSKRASPFTHTIFGYLIEYKLYEMFIKEYGADKVEHGVKMPGMGSEDIDILIKPAQGQFISIEIKPSAKLGHPEELDKIITKMISRTIAVSGDDKKGIPQELWLLVYSYEFEKNNGYIINNDEKVAFNDYSEKIKEALNINVSFKVKHTSIKANKLGQDRHIYQEFMRNIINKNQVKDIFCSI